MKKTDELAELLEVSPGCAANWRNRFLKAAKTIEVRDELPRVTPLMRRAAKRVGIEPEELPRWFAEQIGGE